MQRRAFGLYVHWPFCQSKCPYCDFNSHVSNKVEQDIWQQAFKSEIERTAAELPDRTLGSIFFGGGTPSLMTPETVVAIIDAARASWAMTNDIEVTLEANPTSVEANKFQGFSDAGVNRVSIGIQALRDPDLKALGRLHTVEEARKAFDIARQTFGRVSFDIIYARQNQTLADWETELTQALGMAADHLSLYQLTIEDGTAFGDRYAKGGLKGLPGEDLSADMFELTQNLSADAGLPAYEISNHARSGAESQHNLIYWRSQDWVGVGPGAHGRFTISGKRMATEAHLNPTVWLEAVQKKGNGEASRHIILSDAVREEKLMMGLRLSEGISIREFDDLSIKYNRLIDEGVLEKAGDRIKTTSRGRPLLNAVLRDLLA